MSARMYLIALSVLVSAAAARRRPPPPAAARRRIFRHPTSGIC